MKPADNISHRDPFQPAASVLDKQALEALAATPPAITPAEAGLVLSSTIVGRQQRVARVGNKTYRIGNHIKADKDGQELDFILAEIEPGSVVLVRDGHRYEVLIKRPQHAIRAGGAPTGNSPDEAQPTDDAVDELLSGGGLGAGGRLGQSRSTRDRSRT